MNAADVLDLLAALHRAGVTCWLDGGWGVDALLGEQTRPHGDVDLVVARGDLARVAALLSGRGYASVRDWLPMSWAWRDAAGHEVDLHPVDLTDDGGGDQILADGSRWRYGAPVAGTIDGAAVACCGPAEQIEMHRGYEPRGHDAADVRRLAERFGLPLPAEFVATTTASAPCDRLDVVSRRVLIKLSGEAFGGGAIGIDPDVVKGFSHQIAQAVNEGVQVAVVVGGGNFFRGAELSERGMERSRADYIGMLGTVMNCLALQDFCEKEGIETRVQTAITMGQVAEPYIPRKAVRHLEKGRVVIFGAGAGMPYFSTDTVSAQRALEIKADAVLMSKSGVDGVYDSDPRKNPDAKRYDDLTFDDALRLGLKVVDAAAFALCQENALPMIVFGMDGDDNIHRALLGETIGTVVHAG